MKIKNNKGITLVALVITIVILIILATITINMVFGENGLIKKAEEAKEREQNSRIEEDETLNSMTAFIDSYTSIKEEIGPEDMQNIKGLYRLDMKAEGYNIDWIREKDSKYYREKVLITNEAGQAKITVTSSSEVAKIEDEPKLLLMIINNMMNPQENLPPEVITIIPKGIYEYNGNRYAFEYDIDTNNVAASIYLNKIIDEPIEDYYFNFEPSTGTISLRGAQHYSDMKDEEFPVTEIIIPSTYKGQEVKALGFFTYTNIEKIVIPEGVTTIGRSTFGELKKLKTLELPSTLTTIGEYAFYGCTGLNNITIPNGVTNIGIAAFERCNSLSSITIPNSVTNVGIRAFYRLGG